MEWKKSVCLETNWLLS